jgi:hypothetical protein
MLGRNGQKIDVIVMSNEYSALSNKSILSNGYYINIMTVIYMPMNMQWNLGNPKEMLPAFPTFAYDRSRISFFHAQIPAQGI